MKDVMASMKRKLGPVGLSLVAAALTATAFAGISVAAQDDGASGTAAKKNGNGDVLRGPGPGPGGPPMFRELSEEDQQAMEDFRQCLQDNGAPDLPDPPDPDSIDPSERPAPPDPPSEADREAMQKAFEACEDKLPEGAPPFGFGAGGPGGPGGPPCGPPPGGEQRKGATS